MIIKPSLLSYQAHVEQLAKKLGCKIVQEPNMPGMMYVEFGYVEGPIIKTQADYLTMLHELGHFHWGHTQGRPPKDNERFYFDNGVLHSEAQAWEYALNQAWDEPNDASRKFMWDTCLGSYYWWCYIRTKGAPTRLTNGNRHWVEFICDHPDTYFESIMRRIQGELTNWNIKYEGKTPWLLH